MYVLPTLAECHFTTTKLTCACPKVYDVFALIIKFLGNDWHLKHVTIGLFEAIKTTR
jgi:hypothetical protein